MNDVAAPLYRFFLTDAQSAAREGDTARMRECLELALDFVPDGLRERVLFVAAELTAVPGGPNGVSPPVPAAEVVVRLAAGPSAVLRALPPRGGRIVWEGQDAPPPTSFTAVVPPPARRPRRTWAALAACAGLAAMVLVASGVLPSRVPAQDAGARASRALERGDPRLALEVLAVEGEEPAPSVWLLRARAHEALGDTAAAVHALAAAAARDSDGGGVALKASSELARLEALQEAADASLYAVTPARTPAELEAIATLQERAGHRERARRVRQR